MSQSRYRSAVPKPLPPTKKLPEAEHELVQRITRARLRILGIGSAAMVSKYSNLRVVVDDNSEDLKNGAEAAVAADLASTGELVDNEASLDYAINDSEGGDLDFFSERKNKDEAAPQTTWLQDRQHDCAVYGIGYMRQWINNPKRSAEDVYLYGISNWKPRYVAMPLANQSEPGDVTRKSRDRIASINRKIEENIIRKIELGRSSSCHNILMKGPYKSARVYLSDSEDEGRYY